MLKIANVSSAGMCGIAAHSAQLMAAVSGAAPDIQFSQDASWLNPDAFADTNPITQFNVIHLNYHRGLHSQWTPARIRCFPDLPFVITFHDTYERQPDSLAWDLLACHNVQFMVVHEECDLSGATAHYSNPLDKVRYLRQPCPNAEGRGLAVRLPSSFNYRGWRPTLGTLGFDFPWKNYSMLAHVTADLNWNLRIVGKVDTDRQLELSRVNPNTWFDGYVDEKYDAVALLSSCDATAFIYTCANSGTSGAIRVGMTAGRPLIAAKGCRQFRDLEGSKDGWPITWIDPNDAALRDALQHVDGGGFHLGLIALAHEMSWAKAGPRYADLFELAARRQ